MKKFFRQSIVAAIFLGLLGSVSVAQAWGYECDKFRVGSVEYKSCQGHYGHHWGWHHGWGPGPYWGPGYYHHHHGGMRCYTHFNHWGQPVRRCVEY